MYTAVSSEAAAAIQKTGLINGSPHAAARI